MVWNYACKTLPCSWSHFAENGTCAISSLSQSVCWFKQCWRTLTKRANIGHEWRSSDAFSVSYMLIFLFGWSAWSDLKTVEDAPNHLQCNERGAASPRWSPPRGAHGLSEDTQGRELRLPGTGAHQSTHRIRCLHGSGVSTKSPEVMILGSLCCWMYWDIIPRGGRLKQGECSSFCRVSD